MNPTNTILPTSFSATTSVNETPLNQSQSSASSFPTLSAALTANIHNSPFRNTSFNRSLTKFNRGRRSGRISSYGHGRNCNRSSRHSQNKWKDFFSKSANYFNYINGIGPAIGVNFVQYTTHGPKLLGLTTNFSQVQPQVQPTASIVNPINSSGPTTQTYGPSAPQHHSSSANWSQSHGTVPQQHSSSPAASPDGPTSSIGPASNGTVSITFSLTAATGPFFSYQPTPCTAQLHHQQASFGQQAMFSPAFSPAPNRPGAAFSPAAATSPGDFSPAAANGPAVANGPVAFFSYQPTQRAGQLHHQPAQSDSNIFGPAPTSLQYMGFSYANYSSPSTQITNTPTSSFGPTDSNFGPQQDDNWYMDTGASAHMTNSSETRCNTLLMSTLEADNYIQNVWRNKVRDMARGARRTTGGARKLLGGLGSSPPRCASKCGRCTPCKPVHVPVPPGRPVKEEYYPEAWRCKCGNKLYMP